MTARRPQTWGDRHAQWIVSAALTFYVGVHAWEGVSRWTALAALFVAWAGGLALGLGVLRAPDDNPDGP